MTYMTTYALDPTGPYSDPQDVSLNGGQQRGAAEVSVGGGASLIFWYDTASSSIQLRNYRDGSYTVGNPAVATNVLMTTAGSGQVDPISAVRIANGNVVVTWASAGATSDIYYAIYSAAGNVVVGPTLAETASQSGIRPDVAATATGFVIAWEKIYSGNDHDIVYRQFDASGTGTDSSLGVNTDFTGALDEAPSVAVLADGGIAIAWDRLAGGATSVYQTIGNSDDSVRLAPVLVDSTGTINRDVEVAARPGGYALFYEDSQGYGTSDTDTVGRTFTSNGTAGASYPLLLSSTGNNGDAAAATQSNGYVVVASTLTTANGTNITASILSPIGTVVVQDVTIAGETYNESVASVSWLDDSTVRFTWNRAAGGSETSDEVYTRPFLLSRTITGDAGDDTINVASDNIVDTINAGDGRNIVSAGGGDDTVTGGAGNDVLLGGAGNDTLAGGGGSNELYGGTGSDIYMVTTAGDSTIENANEGFDAVYTALTSYVLQTNVEAVVHTDTTNFVGVGNSGDNTLYGNSGRDELYGGDGNDFLFDGGGDAGSEDAMFGGVGNDIYRVTLKGDSTIESAGQGTDEVQTGISVYQLQANIENLTARDNAQHDAFVGNTLDNVIKGGTGADQLYGREGNDTLYGGTGSANTLLGQQGNDTYYVDAAGDSVYELAGEGIDTVIVSRASFTLPANVENLTFVGTTPASTTAATGIGNALGNQIESKTQAANDFLSGLDGDDVLIGGAGADLLYGGNGSDVFFYRGGETGYDRIPDFVAGADKIGLSSGGFAHTATLALVSGPGAVATSTNSTFLYDTNTGIVSYDADGTGANAAVKLAQLNTGLTLTLADFGFF